MVNQSKVKDPRFLKLWKDSGAIGGLYEIDIRKSIQAYRQDQYKLEILTKTEIKELEKLEFRQNLPSVDEQVRRYYLQLKSTNPHRADHMLADTQPLLNVGIKSVQDIETLCYKIHKYWSGFLISFNGESYSVHNNQIVRYPF